MFKGVNDKFSTKRLFFLVVSAIIIIFPFVMYAQNTIAGESLLNYFKWLGGIYVVNYTAGKYVDKK